jgi:hypothetical protein
MKNVLDTIEFVDQNGNTIKLGDRVMATKGAHAGGTFEFIFCIPQHRFGFINIKYLQFLNAKNTAYARSIFPAPGFIDQSKLDFYYTPRSIKEISLI